MTEHVCAVVVGAGVIGLACARELARAGIETLILEHRDAFGTETSARNSEVIHAGIYYPYGSLKALMCVQGRRLLYQFCDEYGVAYRRCGKLIVATSGDHVATLESMVANAQKNGVEDVHLVCAEEAKVLEPQLSCSAALLSPSTGIIDSHGLMLALLGDAQGYGAVLAVNSPLLSAERNAAVFKLRIGGVTPVCLTADLLINAAGLSASAVAKTIDGLPNTLIPGRYYAKGNYFSLSGRMPFSRLVYPIPEPGGLGVHFTLDMGGQGRFGPDVEWVDCLDYSVAPGRCVNFYPEIRKYWPALADGTLRPAYAGIRPKISGPRDPAADFVVQGPGDHGVPGLVNLFGIESPGLTSCLAIAKAVSAALA